MNDDGSGSAPDVGEDRPRLSTSTVTIMRDDDLELDVISQDLNFLGLKGTGRASLGDENCFVTVEVLDGDDYCHRYNAEIICGTIRTNVVLISIFIVPESIE